MLAVGYAETAIPMSETAGFVPNLQQPEIMHSVLEWILATGDVIGLDELGRIVLSVTVDDWLFDERTAFGGDLENRKPDPDDDSAPAEVAELQRSRCWYLADNRKAWRRRPCSRSSTSGPRFRL